MEEKRQQRLAEEERGQKGVVNNFAAGSNCQVFNAPMRGCVFAMPGSNVTQVVGKTEEKKEMKDGEESKPNRDEEMFHFVHPELEEQEGWKIHNAVKRAVKLQGIQMICQYLMQLKDDRKVLLPPNPSAAYSELVRMGMPNGEGFNEITFRKYYNRK